MNYYQYTFVPEKLSKQNHNKKNNFKMRLQYKENLFNFP